MMTEARRAYMAEYREKNRQRMRDYQNAYTKRPDQRARRTKNHLAWYHRSPENKRKVFAQVMLKQAVDAGRIVRPSKCSKCKTPCRPQAHHEDYTKWRDVVWLCRECHVQLHRKKRSQVK